MKGALSAAAQLRRSAPAQWRWVPPEWQRTQAPTAQYIAALEASAASAAALADSVGSVGACWRAAAARDTLRSLPSLMPLDARQSAALASAMTGLAYTELSSQLSTDAAEVSALVLLPAEKASQASSAASAAYATRRGVSEGDLRLIPPAAALVCLLAECGSFTPAVSAVGGQSGASNGWLLSASKVPPTAFEAASDLACKPPAAIAGAAASAAAEVQPLAASALVTPSDSGQSALASASAADVAPRFRRPATRDRAEPVAPPSADASLPGSSIAPPAAVRSIGGSSGATPLHPSAWVGRWVAWRDYAYSSSAAAVTLPRAATAAKSASGTASAVAARMSVQPLREQAQQPVVEYASRLLSHAELTMRQPSSSQSVDDSGLPFSWFEANDHPMRASTAAAAPVDAASEVALALASSLRSCRVRSPSQKSQFCVSPPSAHGRWIGGWVARFDAASGLHLVVYDTPASTSLPPEELAALDDAFLAAGAGVGIDVASCGGVTADAVSVGPAIVTREWVRLDDFPVVVLPLESRLSRLPPPAALGVPRVLRGRALESPVDAFLSSLPASRGYAANAVSERVCSICFHSGSASDPLLRCASPQCLQAHHVSCFDPLRAAEVALLTPIVQDGRGSHEAPVGAPNDRMHRLLPRTTRDDIFGLALQQRDERTRQLAPTPAGPFTFRTQWLCQTCRACDSCGGAHPGGPFAQNASSVAVRLLDAVADGKLSALSPRSLTGAFNAGESAALPGDGLESATCRRPLLPLWARGGVCGPADSCVSDTASCVKAAEALVVAFSGGLSPSAVKAEPRGPVVETRAVADVALQPAVATEGHAQTDLGEADAPSSEASAAPPLPSAPPAVNAALAAAIRRFGFGAQSTQGRQAPQPKGWAAPDLSVHDRLRWGLHSFTPIPGTLQYNSRRAAALAAAGSSAPGGAASSNESSTKGVVLPSEPIEQLLCAYCVARISDGCFCPVCHGVYTDGDGQMVQVRTCKTLRPRCLRSCDCTTL